MSLFLVRKQLKKAEKIVIKLGTNTVLDSIGNFNQDLISSLLEEILLLREKGKKIILVSSGAIGLGNTHMHWERSQDLLLNQCSASIGQSLLMHAYKSCADVLGIKIAWVLLTREDFKDQTRLGRIKKVLERLTNLGVLVIINENDAVSTEEITFGDNDILAANVAKIVGAELLVLLSNVDGVYKDFASKEVISLITSINQEMQACIQQGTSTGGKGGMSSKYLAAAQASSALTVVANGSKKNSISKIVNGENLGTLFWLRPRNPQK